MLKHKQKMQKIIATLLILVTCTFAVPNFSQADFGGKLFSPVVNLFAALGDVVIGGLQHWMLGTSSLWSASLEHDDYNVTQMTEKIENGESTSAIVVEVAGKNLDRGWFPFDGKYDDIAVPNIIYSPELIFSNLVPALDINFLNPDPSRYNPVEIGTQTPISTGSALHEVIAAWYTAFRNIALVGLLSVLVYVGIRIVISSSAGEKAKYKERLTDWLVALCLLFVMQYIMSFTINITEQITTIFSGSQTIDVRVRDSKVISSSDVESSNDDGSDVEKNVDFAFTTNLMGYMRFMVYLDDLLEKCAYLIIYLVLVIYTVMFTIIYMKRVLYMAFFTMIAPMVALTYPLDKLSDGKAQAFNLWIREYIFNALIQPMHLALYTMLMTSSMYLATTNPIYALIAIGFLFPAEKFIKKMFGFDKAQTAGGAGSFAGGALTMALLNRMRGRGRSGISSSGNDYSGDYIEKGVKTSAISSGTLLNPARNQDSEQNENLKTTEKNQSVLKDGEEKNKGTTSRRMPNGDYIFENSGQTETKTQGGVILTGDSVVQDNFKNRDQTAEKESDLKENMPYVPTFKNRAGMRARNLGNGIKRRLKKAPKSLGKFALNTGVSLGKGLAGAALTAIPAGISLVASGGDVGTASKILGAGAGTMMTIGPKGEEIEAGIYNAVASSNKSARTPEEQKEVEAKKKYRKTIDDTQQIEKLRKVMKKGDKEEYKKYGQSPEKWISENKDIIKEYMKNDVTNLDTIYKAEKLRNTEGSNMDKKYAIELARQSDLIGKRIHNPGFMQDFRNELNQNMSRQDTDRFLNHLNAMDA